MGISNYYPQQSFMYVGLEWDKSTDTYIRLGDAKNRSRTFFDSYFPWCMIRRCNLSDAGVVNAYHGDSTYIEDGSNGQVMVEIPKFYYRVEHVGDVWRWYISPLQLAGFKLHPAFSRNEIEKERVYLGAYEATVYDVSASAYKTDDSTGVDFNTTTGDKLASIVEVKPLSGINNNFTLDTARIVAHNRGTGWELQDFLTTCAIQLLYVIEYANFNSQSTIGLGVTNITTSAVNLAIETGYTGTHTSGTDLGNISGNVIVVHYSTGQTTYPVSYRGIENLWGNIYTFVDGITFNTNRNPYIADHSFISNTYTDPYVNTFFTSPTSSSPTSSYISSIKYSSTFDYTFLVDDGDVTATYSTYFCDLFYSSSTNNKIYIYGGKHNSNYEAGIFSYSFYYSSTNYSYLIGARLAYLG